MAVWLPRSRFGHCPWTLQNIDLALARMIRVFATEGELQGVYDGGRCKGAVDGKISLLEQQQILGGRLFARG